MKRRKEAEQLEEIEKAHDWFSLVKESQRDSDRGCALLLGAFLDVHVAKLILSVLIQRRQVVDQLFDYPGPLSSFGAKVRMAHALRLLHEYEYRDLRRIVRIRNRFAHELQGISFAKDLEVSRLCGALESRAVKGLDTEGIAPRWLFWLTAYSLASDIDNRTLNAKTERRMAAKPLFRRP
jgi:DNA-binding MltR family transcriptional regulator